MHFELVEPLAEAEWQQQQELNELLAQTTCPFVIVSGGDLVHYVCRFKADSTHLPKCEALDAWQSCECDVIGDAQGCLLRAHLVVNRAKEHVFYMVACQGKRDLFGPEVNGATASWVVLK